jgi:ribonuclease-3
MEALFAAIFLDAGFDAAHAAIARLFSPRIAALDPVSHGKDSKTRLQEWLQARRLALPQYVIVRQSGEAHEQQFEVACDIPALGLRTVGRGTSRRSAEQQAATAALAALPDLQESHR